MLLRCGLFYGQSHFEIKYTNVCLCIYNTKLAVVVQENIGCCGVTPNVVAVLVIVTKEVAKYWLVAKVTVLMMKWLIVAGGVTDELLNIRKSY